MVQSLLAAGADIGASAATGGARAFYLAAASGPDRAVKALRHRSAGIDAPEGDWHAHRHVPDGSLTAMRCLVEEIDVDVDARDHHGYNAVHHAAARGDGEMIAFLVAHGADVTAVSRRGQTTADMANGPVQRIQPFPSAVALLESLGAKNNHNCLSC